MAGLQASRRLRIKARPWSCSVYRKFVAESSAPRPVHHRIDFGDLRFFRTIFPAGSWQIYNYASPVRYSQAPTAHMQTAGRVVDAAGAWPAHEAGWMSRSDEFLIPAGSHRRVAEVDSERWCCMGLLPEAGAEHVDCVALTAGQSLDLSHAESLLVASGSVYAGGSEVGPGVRIRASSGGASIVAAANVMAFRWLGSGTR